MVILADVTNISANPYYQNWTCAGFILAFFVAVVSATIKIHTKEDTDLRKRILNLKSQISSLFMKTIIDEARLLVSMIDEHLPYSLSQACSKNPTTSRFDYFCGLLKNLSLDPSPLDPSQNNSLQENRDKYASIIKDAFSGILKEEIEKLIRIISTSPKLNDTSYNSTGIRYGLEGETSLKFDFIARKMTTVERWHRNYNRCGIISKLFLILAAIAALSFIVSVFFLNSINGKTISMYIIGIMFLSGIIGFAIIGFFFHYESKLKNENQLCENDPGYEKTFEKWKGRQN